MSHEIRTPMNGVIGMTELLLDSNLDQFQREQAETIHSSSNALLTIINDILDFSKVEAGRLELESVPFDLRETVHDVAELLSASAHRKGTGLHVHVGMDDFLSKPIRSAHLAAALGRWLIPTAAIPEAGIGVTSNTQMTPASNMSETDVTGLERESHGDAEGQALAPTVALDAEALKPIWELEALWRAGLFDEMYALFQQDGTARLAELRAVLGSQDVQGLYRLAHAMKGEALAWGATDLAEACRQLEDRARVDDGPPLAGLVGAVERLFRATLTALDATRKAAA